jgi:hypothetical protein
LREDLSFSSSAPLVWVILRRRPNPGLTGLRRTEHGTNYRASADDIGLEQLTEPGLARIEIVAGDEGTIQDIAGAIGQLGVSPLGASAVWRVPEEPVVRARVWLYREPPAETPMPTREGGVSATPYGDLRP